MIDAIAARHFCLQIIAQVYGYQYRPDWHADLDSLLDRKGIYSTTQKGYFAVRKEKEVIVAVGGLRNLSTHEKSWHRFQGRYGDAPVGALWRVYVDDSRRGSGIGTALVRKLEAQAARFGYQHLYLHTSWRNPAAVKFWTKQGFSIFAEDQNDDQTVHMEKALHIRN